MPLVVFSSDNKNAALMSIVHKKQQPGNSQELASRSETFLQATLLPLRPSGLCPSKTYSTNKPHISEHPPHGQSHPVDYIGTVTSHIGWKKQHQKGSWILSSILMELPCCGVVLSDSKQAPEHPLHRQQSP